MSLHVLASLISGTAKKPPTPIHHLLSRVLAVRNHNFTGHPEKTRLCSYYHRTSIGESEPLDFEFLQHGSFSNPYLLNKAISFCAHSCSKVMGVQLHSVIVKLGFVFNVYITSAVIDMYAKCGEIGSAQQLFDEVPERNVVTWNSLISGYLNVNCPQLAVGLFVKMLGETGVVSSYSISACLVGCSQLEDEGSELGIQVHGLITKAGFVGNVVIGTALIDMYSNCGSIEESRLVFDHMEERNVLTWNSIVSAYAQREKPEASMVLVRSMTSLGVKPNYVTYNSLLASFCSPQYLSYCKQVHCCVIKRGLESNEYIAVTLVSTYSKCSNNLQDFKSLCSGVKLCSSISWNVVISGYCNVGSSEDAMKSFYKMAQTGISMDSYTFTCVLGAVGDISGLKIGIEIHALILKMGISSNVCVQNALVSMYARCGAIEDSKKVFRLMEKHDLISWNALLTGFSRHGYGDEAVELFEQMRKANIKPSSSTFLAALSACSSAGLVDKGLEYVGLMANNESIGGLKVEHYACVVDIFGRAGYLSEAEAIISKMPMDPGSSVYKALLSSCLVHGNKEIAARIGKKLLDLYPDDPAAYVLLSNVSRSAGCWNDSGDIWRLMSERGVRKKPACSWI